LPVYEFYCSDCHAIFNFYSRKVNTEKRPDCPWCGKKDLERQVSRFAVSRGLEESHEEGLPPGMDEAKLEQAMMSLASEAEGLNEDDPRQAAHLMRKLYDAAGMRMSTPMKEALGRMEAGEDLEKIEEEMGDILDDEDLFSSDDMFGNSSRKALRKKILPPERDETLYEL